MFGHRAANILNRLAYFLANGIMCIDGLLLSLNVFDSNFLFCLSDAKFVGSEFSTTNAIKQIFLFSDPFSFLNVSCANSSIKPFITSILENAKHAASNASLFCSPAKLTIRILYAVTKQHAALVFCELFLILLSVSLLNKIGLSCRNFWF